MPFSSAAEAQKYIGGIFESAFADPELGPKLAGTGIVLEITMSEPESHLVVDTTSSTVFTDTAGAPAPTASMSMSSETSNAYWQGKVNLPMAMAKKKVTVNGNIAALLKLAPLSKKLFPAYIERLRSDGRTDLLV
ncbi:SCP2 sterol-binding domain-containing protein [Williamsia sp. CHRR-6]|uniref:SCP2 sterol-binding domain-containing protein n=1 Tax=Williamsia sp. CHRR-6 TaxID=2835871 RepID=UPI001BD9BCD4|nr:SCP2 sterol-binding domain-containing protein [Williamsia sp. CHRR-6]MBT0568519.1 SCP2 sterol-binding domain-containing protein [Williamsia sp. CHRR-6]